MPASIENLGRLERVPLREVWASEAGIFTPWLAREENLRLLGDTLGIELQLEAQEKEVGPYRADIVCQDTADESWVLIENQLEPTDHIHLGQILTYAAGLDAVTVVWIAERFTDEHRATLDWLNEISSEDFRFFGLELEVWRIGASTAAPKFNVVAKPNDWTKGGGGKSRIRDAALTERKKLQLGFWHGFREHVLSNSRIIKPTKPLPQHWMNIAIGRSGFKLTAIASMYDSSGEAGYDQQELRAEFEINDRDHSKGYYAILEAERDQIESELGEELTWYNPENAVVCRIYLRRNADLEDEQQRGEQYAWLLEKLERLYRVFSPRVKALRAPQPSEGELGN